MDEVKQDKKRWKMEKWKMEGEKGKVKKYIINMKKKFKF